MKRYSALLALITLLCIFAIPLTGCARIDSSTTKEIGAAVSGFLDPGSQPTGHPSEATTTTPGTLTVVILDVSGSTLKKAVRRMYLKTLEFFATHITPGDRFMVLTVDRASVQNSVFLVDVSVPPFTFEASQTPAGTNPIILRKFRSDERTRYEMELARYRREVAPLVTEARGCIDRTVRHEVLAAKSGGSDLPGAVQVAGAVFSVAQPETTKRLIILSDAVTEGVRGVDWRDQEPTADAVAALIERERASGALPDLARVEVMVIGARGRSERHFAALANAWTSYIDASGGTLERRFFMGNPNPALLDSWADEDWQPPPSAGSPAKARLAGR